MKKQLDSATLVLGKAQLMLELVKKSESQGLNLYELIDEDSAEKCLFGFWGLSISEQCKLLKVSRSGYYNWKKRRSLKALHTTEADNEKKEPEMKLVKDVMDAFMEHPSFGYRKMTE